MQEERKVEARKREVAMAAAAAAAAAEVAELAAEAAEATAAAEAVAVVPMEVVLEADTAHAAINGEQVATVCDGDAAGAGATASSAAAGDGGGARAKRARRGEPVDYVALNAKIEAERAAAAANNAKGPAAS